MGTSGEPPSGLKWRSNWAAGGILRALVIWSGIGIGIGTIVEIVFARLASGAWLWQAASALTSAQWYDVTRSSIATVGLFGLGGAALLAYRRQGTAEKNEKTSAGQHELEMTKNANAEILDLRARYAVAAEQLGHERPAVRLAGVYSIAALADDWQVVNNFEQQKVCVDVLCAYLRMSYDPASEVAKGGEKEVRLTIIKTIAERLQDPNSPHSWNNLFLDFTGAVFDGGTFDGAEFSGGRVSFNRAKFTGGRVTFNRAKFTGDRVSFNRAKFIGGNVDFIGARFTSGYVTFIDTEFSEGNVDFNDAEFTGAYITFHNAEFSGGYVTFNRTRFTHGYVTFNGAKFTSGNVIFNNAKFSGGNVDFNDARFTGGNILFNHTEFTGGDVTFNNILGSSPSIIAFDQPASWTTPPNVPWGGGQTPPWVSPDFWPPALASVLQTQEEL